jgi:hypothetical protein
MCDLCFEDHTASIEKGGFVFGNNAVCPTCAPDFLKKIKANNEQTYINAKCPKNTLFSDFIREYRSAELLQAQAGHDAQPAAQL